MHQHVAAQPFCHTAHGGVSRLSRHRELLLNCARIGFNP
jgi:hypothetical protein